MTGYQSKKKAAQDKLTQPAQEPVAKEKIHALEPMLEALHIKQTVTFDESQSLFSEVARKSGMLPPPFELSGNQWCALVNLAVVRFGNIAPPQRPWVGLTAEEAAECWTTSATQTWKNIEAKLKKKNI